jgi:ABC-type multidrug transport system fused ATPase/permease subunit
LFGIREAFVDSWSLLTRSAKRKIFVISLITISLSALDFLAVGLIGLVGALAIRGIQSQGIGDRTNQILSIVGLENASLSNLITIFGLSAFLLLVMKSFLVYFFTRRLFIFMSNRATDLSDMLLKSTLNQPIDYVNKRSTQEYIFHVNSGTANLMIGIVGNAFAILTDLALFVFLVTLLIIVDPSSAFISTLVFIAIGFSLNLVMQKRAVKLGILSRSYLIGINETITELFTSLREIKTRNSQEIYRSRIVEGKSKIIRVAADQKMMPLFSKYLMEISVFATFLIIAVLQFTLNDTSRAVGNLALFFAATTRLSPAVLRMQQSYVQLKSAIGSGKATLDLLNVDSEFRLLPNHEIKLPKFSPSVVFENVSFCYQEKRDWSMRSVSFQIAPYSFVAFVGGSGAGKSTIIDLLFGLLNPQMGQVLVSGLPARLALETWPGKFGYVPQNVAIHKGTVLSNLLLGLEDNEINRSLANNAIQRVGLRDLFAESKFGLDAELDDRGSNLSGGQRQRLGIARALVSQPELLVLDESTSSLDAISENSITESLANLRGSLTIIVIAHRLSTVRKADQLFFVDSGKIAAQGDFDTLRSEVPDFDLQSKLMGLL